jgi:hypothetical protein
MATVLMTSDAAGQLEQLPKEIHRRVLNKIGHRKEFYED